MTAAAEPIHRELSSEEVDLHIGRRLRRRRRILGLSQEGLANMVGIRFQQVQKYECAATRVCAARLHDLARALGVNVNYFFEGLPGGAPAAEALEIVAEEIMNEPKMLELAKAFARLPKHVRQELLGLVQALSADS